MAGTMLGQNETKEAKEKDLSGMDWSCVLKILFGPWLAVAFVAEA